MNQVFFRCYRRLVKNGREAPGFSRVPVCRCKRSLKTSKTEVFDVTEQEVKAGRHFATQSLEKTPPRTDENLVRTGRFDAMKQGVRPTGDNPAALHDPHDAATVRNVLQRVCRQQHEVRLAPRLDDTNVISAERMRSIFPVILSAACAPNPAPWRNANS